MSQITSGIRSILSMPAIYSLYQKIVFPKDELVREYIRPFSGQKILDIGCGTGDVLKYLPNADYFGIDVSKEYIEAARKRYGDRAQFLQTPINQYNIAIPHMFDLVLAIAVLHHISDEEIISLFQLAKQGLKKNGRLFSVEPCYMPAQSYLSRLIISKDRGQNVKDVTGYLHLAKKVFSQVNYTIRHDLLRIPFTLILLECIA